MHFLAILLLLRGDVPAGRLAAAAYAEQAYAELRLGHYDAAVAGFRESLAVDGGQAHLRKDLAYTLLKRGDREEAREEFERALELDPKDERAALEYGFLCYETRRVQAARRTFLRLRESGNEEVRRTAAEAFERVDGPLREGLERWSEAIRLAPRQWSAHEELARLAEAADRLELAAEHYEHAWRLRPSQDSLLLDLARVWQGLGEEERARQALARAWRDGPPRVAETAREMLAGGVPAETEVALARPEPEEAEEVYAAPPLGAREMGERSLAGSYLNDAYRYFREAHDDNPADGEVALKLGITSNLLRRDREALKWFALARRSAEPSIARSAEAAYEALAPSYQKVSFSAWSIPYYSSRWGGAFLYGQAKAEWKAGRLPVTPYLSVRFVGDTAGRLEGRPMGALFLSENSVIPAVGLRRRINGNAFAWAEAGQAVSYRGRRADAALSIADYRGGVSLLKGWGRLLGAERGGRFMETNVDGVYASRFGDDLLLYVQNRTGYTFGRGRGGWQVQAHVAWNITADRRGEYWGNIVEAGPGVRLVLPGLPRGMSWRAEVLRGAHLVNTANPWGPNYWDFRTGIWYAFAH
jgi:tetratricopeptide (TPR) repeat protein